MFNVALVVTQVVVSSSERVTNELNKVFFNSVFNTVPALYDHLNIQTEEFLKQFLQEARQNGKAFLIGQKNSERRSFHLNFTIVMFELRTWC